MADNPADWEEKMHDIGMLLENINAVLNLLRPHQAREGVKTMLLNRLEEAREEMERCDEMKREVEKFLRRVEGDGNVENEAPRAGHATDGVHKKGPPDSEAHTEQARSKWTMLDGLEGD